MRRLLLTAIGAIYISVLVVLPAFHVTTWSGDALPVLVAALGLLPVLALVVAVAHPATWATLGLFPLSHLPVLVAAPELSGHLVYDGLSGLAALLGVATVHAAWVAAALRPPARPRLSALRPLLLPATATLVGLVVFAAFLLPVLDAGPQPDAAPAQLALILGGAIAGWLGARVATGDLGDLFLDDRAREPWLAAVLASRRTPSLSLGVALALTLVLGAFVLIVYGTHSP